MDWRIKGLSAVQGVAQQLIVGYRISATEVKMQAGRDVARKNVRLGLVLLSRKLPQPRREYQILGL